MVLGFGFWVTSHYISIVDIVDIIIDKTSWLYTRLYENPLFFFDLWSLVHLWIGFVLFFLIKSIRIRKTFLYLFLILLAYGIIEFTIVSFRVGVFQSENIKGQISDIIVGILGGLIGLIFYTYLKRKPNHIRFQYLLIAFLSGVTYSFLWVGIYQYQYNMSFFNTPGINFGAFLFWLAGSWGTIEFFRLFKKRKLWVRILITWTAYIFGLFMFEYIAYEQVEIHEISRNGENPLIFGLIHGTWYLHLVYLTQALTSICIYLGLSKLITGYFDYQHP